MTGRKCCLSGSYFNSTAYFRPPVQTHISGHCRAVFRVLSGYVLTVRSTAAVHRPEALRKADPRSGKGRPQGQKFLSFAVRRPFVTLHPVKSFKSTFMTDKKLKILIIGGGEQKNLCAAIRQRGHEVAGIVNPWEFGLYLSNSTNGYDRLYLRGNRVSAKDYDAVITRVGSSLRFAAKVIRHLQVNLHIFCTQTGRGIETCSDKWTSAQIMSAHHIRVPRQYYCIDEKQPAYFIEQLGGLPIILKELTGSKGKGLIMLESPLQTNMTLESYYGSGRNIILQEYLKNGGKDERHIVVGGRVVSSMERSAPADDIRANLSLAGKGRAITPTEEVRKMCVDAVAAIPGLNFAGVDIIKRKETGPDGKEREVPYFVEINSNPGSLICDITGYNHFNDLVEWVEDHYKDGGAGAALAESSGPELLGSSAGYLKHSEKIEADMYNLLQYWAKKTGMDEIALLKKLGFVGGGSRRKAFTAESINRMFGCK